MGDGGVGPRNPRQGVAPPWAPEGPVLEYLGLEVERGDE